MSSIGKPRRLAKIDQLHMLLLKKIANLSILPSLVEPTDSLNNRPKLLAGQSPLHSKAGQAIESIEKSESQ